MFAKTKNQREKCQKKGTPKQKELTRPLPLKVGPFKKRRNQQKK